MSERFYIDQPLSRGRVELTGAEAHHLATVCRLRVGDALSLFNGDGHEYIGRLAEVSRRQVAVDVIEVESPQRELGFSLEVAAPLPKGDRSQFLVEKLTELGVTSFVPLSTVRSVIHPRDAKLDKLRRHVIEASKQCGRNLLMDIRAPADWPTHCRGTALPATRLLAHPCAVGQTFLSAHHPGKQECSPTSVTIAVGPEGGLTEDEVSLAREAQWQLVDLGPRILRVETAALMLVMLVLASRAKAPP